MDAGSAERLFELIKQDNAEGFSELVPSVFPLYSFPTTLYKPNDALLQDTPPLVSILVYYGAIKCLEYMSTRGADFTDTDDFGREPIHFLGYAPNTQALVTFLKLKGVSFDAVDNSEKNLLSKAVEMKDPSLLRVLLSQKICSYAVDSRGYSPFYVAVASGQLTSVTTLYNLYYDQVLHEITSSDDVINCAVKNNFKDIVIFLMAKQSGRESKFYLNTAIYLSNQTLLEYFINTGEDVNAPDESGFTPLVFAIQREEINMVVTLLEHGADPLKGDAETPFQAAIDICFADVINKFIDNLPTVDAVDCKGQTMLHYSAAHTPYDSNIFTKLLDHGASLGIRNKDGITPAELAVRNGDIKMINDMIDRSIALSGEGYSLLHTAAAYNNIKVLKTVLPLEKRNLDEKFDGKTPIMFAASTSPLLREGIDPKDEQTALDDIAALLDIKTFEKHFKCAIELVRNGAEITAEAVSAAVEAGDPLAALFFLLMGASANSRSRARSLLEIADEEGFSVIASLVVFFGGADPGMDLHEEEMPLMDLLYQTNDILQIGARFSPPNIVHYLIEKSNGYFDVDDEDGYGLRPIHQAIQAGMLANLEILFEYEAAHVPVDVSHPNIIYSIAANPVISSVPVPSPQMSFELLNKTIDQLLARGERLDAPDSDGRTPLAIAFETRNTRVIEVLMNHKAMRNFSQTTPNFIQYVLSLVPPEEFHRSDVSFTEFISRDFERISEDEFVLNGTSIDIYAAIYLIVLSIKMGENVNSPLLNGETLLHAMCRYNLIDMVEYLVTQGADINAPDSNGQTPLHHLAIAGKDVNIDFLEHIQGVSYNEQDKVGRTPFSYAAQYGDAHMLEFLSEHGAAVSGVDAKGVPAINYAVKSGNAEAFRFLIRNKASAFATNADRVAPIHIAAELGQLEVMADLVQIPGQLRLRDKNGNTALHYATRAHQMKIISFLTQDPTLINELNGDRETPLTMACNALDKKLVEFYLSLGARFQPSQAYQALRGPLAAGDFEYARRMLENGLKPDLKCGKDSLLTWAVINKNMDALKWLMTTARCMHPLLEQDITPIAAAYVLEYDDLCDFLAKVYPENTIPAILANFMPNLPQRIAEIRRRKDREVHDALLKEVLGFGRRHLPRELRRYIQVSDSYTMYRFAIGALEPYDLQMIASDLTPGEAGGDRAKFEEAFGKINLDFFGPLLGSTPIEQIMQALWDNDGELALSCLERLSLDTIGLALGGAAVGVISAAINARTAEAVLDALSKVAMELIRLSDAKRKTEMMQAALESGCSPNMRNEEGYSLLHIAVNNRNFDMVKLLLKYGARPNKVNKIAKRSIAEDAVAQHVPEAIRAMVSYGLITDRHGEDGSTFVHAVVKSGQNELLKFLLDWGTPTQLADADGKTLLHAAIEATNIEGCRILLDAGAITDVVDNEGVTPAKLAMNIQNGEITQLLFSKGSRF